MEARTLFLHIGLPKTATTYLQEEYFPRLPHVRYLGTPRSELFSTAEDLQHGQRTLTACVKRAPMVWERYGDAVLRDIMGKRPTATEGDVLLSDEGVGRAGSRPELLRAHLEGFSRLAGTWGFGTVRVLCMIRRQDHWMASHYAQISDRNPAASQADFEANVQEKLNPSGSRYSIGALLEYDTLAAQLMAAVGESNVMILPYELLSADPQLFDTRLRAFLRIPSDWSSPIETPHERHNVRATAPDVWRLRATTQTETLELRPWRLLRALGLPEELRLVRSPRRKPQSIRLTEEMTRAVLAEYEAANRRCAARTGLDLGRHGYYVSA